jgi:cytochrome c oxidase assembly protein subunit 11
MERNHKTTIIYLLALIFAMLCLVVASVPLYNLFCKVTGYSGTARSNVADVAIGTRPYEVSFNVDMILSHNWQLKALTPKVTTLPGKVNLVLFEFVNNTQQDMMVTALYNIVPARAASYFVKIECFCYEELNFAANSVNQLPVSFYLDSAIEQDPFLKDINKITLSYSVSALNEGK